MPELTWVGKRAVENHHREVPYRLLKCDAALSAGDVDSGNLLVEGDNLEALKALLPFYRGQVKCIYIDPPYNTGNEKWIYNDSVNSPEIRKWLGKVVGGEVEDLSRHDKWLCMMWPRLALLLEFLRDDGAIFISIDDNEVDRLNLIMAELSGVGNRVCTFIWKRRTTPDSRNLNGVSADHEYVVCYQKALGFRIRGQLKDMTKYSNPDGDPRGNWMSDNLTGLANARERPNLHYDVINPETGIRYPPHSSRGWIYGPERMAELITDNRLLWPKKPSGRPRLKRFESDMQSATTGYSTVLEAPGNVEATKELAEIMGPKTFAFPKPSRLIAELVAQASGDGDLVLDSFAGSGTTGHAVLRLNKEDGARRRFILVEMDTTIARDLTAERIRRVATGYRNAKGEDVAGLGGGFRYCKLGEALFDGNGQINSAVTFSDLARHVFFITTGQPLSATSRRPQLLVGTHGETAVYLLYNGVLGDKRREGGNVLTGKVLAGLPSHEGHRVIFGEATTLSPARLRREGIEFRQIPYDVRSS